MEEIKVLLVKSGEVPEVISIPNTLKSLQEIVGGYIEPVFPFEDNVCLIVNEDGKFLFLRPNRSLRDKNDKIYDIIHGTFLVVGVSGEDFSSLTPEQITKYERFYHMPEYFR